PARCEPGAGSAGGCAGRDRAAAGHGDRAGGGFASARGKSALGLTAGPVPPRVDATVKAGLLGLIAHAGERGWSARRACALLGLDCERAAHWRQRARVDRLADLPCGGGAVHGLLDTERIAIVELFESWAGVDRSHR